MREHASGGVDVRMAAEVAREVLARSFRNQEAREKGEHIQVRTGSRRTGRLDGRPLPGRTGGALRAAFDGKKTAVSSAPRRFRRRVRGGIRFYFSIEMSGEEVTETYPFRC
ncbi:MAG: hypothetical protein ACLR6J_03925 [Parabacteroides merdae]